MENLCQWECTVSKKNQMAQFWRISKKNQMALFWRNVGDVIRL